MKKYSLITEISQQDVAVNYIPRYANVYYANTLNVYSEIGNYLYKDGYLTYPEEYPIRVIGLRVKKNGEITRLTETYNLSDCIQNASSYYYDFNTKDIFIHFPDHKPPNYYSEEDIITELAFGFTKTNYDGQLLVDGLPYDKRITKIPTIKKTLDDELVGIQKFTDFSISLDNTDGRYDGWISDPRELLYPNSSVQKKLRGNLVRYLFAVGDNNAVLETYANYSLLQQGNINSLSDGTTVTFDCNDVRQQIIEPLANNSVDTIGSLGYDIKEGVIKPWILGSKYGHECKCLNKDVNKDSDYTAGLGSYFDYKYLLCDVDDHSVATDAVKTIYIDSIETNITVTVEIDEVNNLAYFVIPVEEFATIETNDVGDTTGITLEGQDKVSVDVEGYLDDANGTFTGVPNQLIDRGMNQIKYVIFKTRGEPYNDLFYNTLKWDTFEINSAYNFKTGIAFYKPKKCYEFIEEIANKSLFGKFIIDADRRYSWDSDDYLGTYTSEFSKELLVEGWFEGDSVEKKYDNILPFFWVQYQKRDDDVEQIQYYDDIFKDNAFNRYLITAPDENTVFKTNLVELADVQSFAARVHQVTDYPDINVSFTISDWNVGIGTQSQSIEAGDFIRVELTDTGDRGYGWSIIKVLSCEPIVGTAEPGDNDWTVNIDGRIIRWDSEYLLSQNGSIITDDSGSLFITTGGGNESEVR